MEQEANIRVPLPGERYQHYKGGTFEVIAVGCLSEQRDQVMVVYRSLERGHVWIRPFGMWREYLDYWTENSIVKMHGPRFRRLTQEECEHGTAR